MTVIVVLACYVVVSIVTFILYAVDKRRAGSGGWRIPEKTLHMMESFGGWPGALIAQRVFRHKWRKRRYVVVFWLIVLIHVVGWAAWYAGPRARS
jgi:uncharacterized membrane protein YsdA (DUF1294 family)